MRGKCTGAGIREEQRDAQLAGGVLEETLFGAVVGRAGEAGEVDEQGHFFAECGCGGLGLGLGLGLRGQVEVEGHFAAGGGGVVGEFEEFAAEGGDCCFCFYGGHFPFILFFF